MKILWKVVSTVLNSLSAKVGVSRILLPALSLAIILTAGGCMEPSSSPTTPESGSEPSSTPTPEPPDKELTPDPGSDTCDNFADDREDFDLPLLPSDGIPLTVSMECAGDVDWYVIELLESPVMLEILLSDIEDGGDFDLKLYDSDFMEFEDGRSSQSGSSDETLSLMVDGSRVYLQVYAFSGRGEATLEAIAAQGKELGEGDDVGDDPDAEPETEPESEDEEELIEQLSYEELLSTTFWFYPRGNSSDLLERSNETLVQQSIFCQSSEVWGELTIGNFAHVERDLLESVDYIDGWALVVFNGSKSVLEQLDITIRVSVLASSIDGVVEAPVEMTLDGDDYIASKKRKGVYYLSHTYGDLSAKSDADLKVSSGVVGELGEGSSNALFQQQVEVEWSIEDSEGIVCFGQALGDSIVDFELGNYLRTIH